MPKVTLTAQQALEERVVRNICVLAAKHGIRDNAHIAAKAHIAKTTFNNKIRHPRMFRLDDLYQVATAFGAPITALFEK